MDFGFIFKQGGEAVACFRVKAGFVVRVDLHKRFLVDLEEYMKSYPDNLRIDKNRGIIHSWGLFMFFAGPSGDPDVVIDPRIGEQVTAYHQKRIDAFFGKSSCYFILIFSLFIFCNVHY